MAKLAVGKYDLSKRWFMADETGMLAALTRYPVARPIYMLRTVQELSDEARAALLAYASTLGEGEGAATLNFTAATAVDLSGAALELGWTLEAHVKGFDTPL